MSPADADWYDALPPTEAGASAAGASAGAAAGGLALAAPRRRAWAAAAACDGWQERQRTVSM